MGNEVALPASLMVTEWTVKWLFSCVFGHVLLQVLALLEPPLAVGPRASKWSLQYLFLLVKIKLLLGLEANATVWTCQWTWGSSMKHREGHHLK